MSLTSAMVSGKAAHKAILGRDVRLLELAVDAEDLFAGDVFFDEPQDAVVARLGTQINVLETGAAKEA